MTELPLVLSEEVQDALADGRPVLGLESNVIAHGLPAPESLYLAEECERDIRSKGVVPALTYLDKGQMHVGATPSTVERLSEGAAWKVTSRDIASVLRRGTLGATSVGATMRLCGAAGVQVVASAGLGGVHRDYNITMDMSGDLHELARSPVAVISAGVKKFLDIPRTCEVLESFNVPVVGRGTDLFPGFYCKDGGVKLTCRVDDWSELADAAKIHLALGAGGFLVVVPPSDGIALDDAMVEKVIDVALRTVADEGVTGKDVTKRVMRAIDEGTKGASRKANRHVQREVVFHGADFARAYSSGELS